MTRRSTRIDEAVVVERVRTQTQQVQERGGHKEDAEQDQFGKASCEWREVNEGEKCFDDSFNRLWRPELRLRETYLP